ncbi:MAG: TetR/AcrR family transcriptional regulator [Myxococcota bacterium]
MAARSDRTRTALLDAAAEVLSRKPRATLADIATAAGVGRATLHRHFKSRDDLVQTLAKHALDQTDEACSHIDYYNQAASVSLRQTLEAIVPLGSRYAFLSYQNISERDDGPIAAQLRRQGEQLRELVVAARDEGMFAPEVSVAWIVATIDALIYAAWNTVSDGSVAPNDVTDLIMRTLTRGLAAG